MEAEEVACLEEKEQSRVGASMAARGHRSSGGMQCMQQRERERENKEWRRCHVVLIVVLSGHDAVEYRCGCGMAMA